MSDRKDTSLSASLRNAKTDEQYFIKWGNDHKKQQVIRVFTSYYMYYRHPEKYRYRYKTYGINNVLDQLFIKPITDLIAEYYYPVAYLPDDDCRNGHLWDLTIADLSYCNLDIILTEYFHTCGYFNQKIKPSLFCIYRDLNTESGDDNEKGDMYYKICHMPCNFSNRQLVVDGKRMNSNYLSDAYDTYKWAMLVSSYIAAKPYCKTFIAGMWRDLCNIYLFEIDCDDDRRLFVPILRRFGLELSDVLAMRKYT